MKQKTDLSTFSLIVTLASVALFVFLIFFNHPPVYVHVTLIGCLALMLLLGLYYMPLSIGADRYAIYINRSLRIKAIPMQEVKSVRICPPTMGALRISGSGGFMGYWGWFRERDLGIYFACYGRSGDCFLVELHSGRKYILGCRNASQMVEHIRQFVKE
ncbi:MAG: hypothetical protein IJ476_09005 [Bacteroidales bacterium]|nr:hypothetical protein [Bacteroidales bacterium]